MKICSLLPSGTEILFALGIGDQIIGITDLCDYPKETLHKRIVCRSKIDVNELSSEQVDEAMHKLLESGESPFELDSDWLEDHAPDVILTQDLCYFCEIDASTVHEHVENIPDMPDVVILNPKNLSEIFDSILQVGSACRRPSKAKTLVNGLKQRVQNIEDKFPDDLKRPKVFSLEGINPLVIGGHWIPDLLQRAGGQQTLFSAGGPAQRIDWQEVVGYAPEKLFIDLCSSDLNRHQREIPWLFNQPDWWDIPAVKSGEVYMIDHVYFSRPGPRIVKGIEITAELTHPDLFHGMVPENTVLKLDPYKVRSVPISNIASCFYPYSHPSCWNPTSRSIHH